MLAYYIIAPSFGRYQQLFQSKNNIDFDLNEIAFSKWNAVGVSSISGLIEGDLTRIYAIENIK